MASIKLEEAFLRSTVRDFPRLAVGNFKITSPISWSYNCIAWASGDNTKWWWPVGKYWPGSSPKSTSIDSFTMMFGTLGFTEATNGDFEAGFEKIALYANNAGQVTHAARQLPAGMWTSKLGQHYDIAHALDALEGGAYGSVVKFMKCQLPASTSTGA